MRVIIDTDPGIDDAHAIVFALKCRELDVEAITTVFGNCVVTDASRNALHLLERADRLEIPVFEGAAEPWTCRRLPPTAGQLVHGPTGTGSYVVEPPPPLDRIAPSQAADELARRVMASPGEITILALAPLTNLALAIEREPGFLDAVHRIIFMGGIVQGPGNVTAVATANVLNDVEAAALVFERSAGKLTMVGQDVTRHVRILDDRYDRLGTECGKDGAFLHELSAFYRDRYHNIEPQLGGFPVHDLLVPIYALRPEYFGAEQMAVRIEQAGELTTGMTVADMRSFPEWPRDVTVCRHVDATAILDWYENVVAR